MIGDILDKVQAKIGRGYAWVNIQKKKDQELGVGGAFSIKRSKIYLRLDMIDEGGGVLHNLEVVKCRGRARSELNPVKHYWKFRLIDGIKTEQVEEG